MSANSTEKKNFRRRLRAQLKKKRQNGEEGWYIKNDQLIKAKKRLPQLFFRSNHADHWTHLNTKTPILSHFVGHSDQQNTEDPHKPTSSPLSFPWIDRSDRSSSATFNPEKKVDDDEYYLNKGSSDDSDDDDDDGVKYEDPTTLLLTGKTKELMRLLQVYRRDNIDSSAAEEHKKPSDSREQKADSDATVHMEQTVGRHFTPFEKRLKEQPPSRQHSITIDNVTYVNVLTHTEEEALVQCISKASKANTGVTLEEVCHLVCNFCLATNIEIPPAWMVNRLSAMEWVKGFLRRSQISHLFPWVKNCDNCCRNSDDDDCSAAIENMGDRQAVGLLVCGDVIARSSKSTSEVINLDHAYALKPETKEFFAKYFKGNDSFSKLVRF